MIYFDHAATSWPKPDCVKEAAIKALDLYGNPGRGIYSLSMNAARMVYETRGELLKFFDAHENDCAVFTSGATESLNMVIKGMLEAKDHVITTAMEHNSVLRPLYEMNVNLDILPLDNQGNIELKMLQERINDETKMVVCAYASNVTGNINPISEIAEICHAKGVLLVIDAAQAAGCHSISMQKEGIDVLCFSAHKGLLGPTGLGGMIIPADLKIKSIKSGGSGFDSYSKTQPVMLPERLEAGTLPIHQIAMLQKALQYIQITGIEQIEGHANKLAEYFYQKMKENNNLFFYGDYDNSKRTPIVSFSSNLLSSDEIADELSENYDIAVRCGAHCAPLVHQHFNTVESGMVRCSFAFSNTIEEVEKLISALNEILGEAVLCE